MNTSYDPDEEVRVLTGRNEAGEEVYASWRYDLTEEVYTVLDCGHVCGHYKVLERARRYIKSVRERRRPRTYRDWFPMTIEKRRIYWGAGYVEGHLKLCDKAVLKYFEILQQRDRCISKLEG